MVTVVPRFTPAAACPAPALAAAIRDDLRGKLDPGHLAMADAMQVLRPIIRQAHDLDIRQRRQVFRDLASSEAIAALLSDGMSGLRGWLVRRHSSLDKHLPRT